MIMIFLFLFGGPDLSTCLVLDVCSYIASGHTTPYHARSRQVNSRPCSRTHHLHSNVGKNIKKNEQRNRVSSRNEKTTSKTAKRRYSMPKAKEKKRYPTRNHESPMFRMSSNAPSSSAISCTLPPCQCKPMSSSASMASVSPRSTVHSWPSSQYPELPCPPVSFGPRTRHSS